MNLLSDLTLYMSLDPLKNQKLKFEKGLEIQIKLVDQDTFRTYPVSFTNHQPTTANHDVLLSAL